MNMSPDQEDFKQLRQLLALKRHEIPPPGYFEGFSRQVMARIKAGGKAEDRAGWVLGVPWFRRVWDVMERQPIWAGAFGAAVCALLVWGVVAPENADERQSMGLAVSGNPLVQTAGGSEMGVLARAAALHFPSTNPVVSTQPRSSLFDEMQLPRPALIDTQTRLAP